MSETDESEAGSLVPILASELYPKMELVSDDDTLSVPFPVLCGESVTYLGRTSNGVAALSNFRFFVRYTDSFVNIPLGLIDSIECRDIFYLYIYCKDARSVRCTFATNESCLHWYKRLGAGLTHPTKLTQVFAYAFHAWSLDTCSILGQVVDGDCGSQLCHPCGYPGYSIGKEIERLGFDLKRTWRISYANDDFKLCGSYPRLHLVPASFTDKDLESVASFRTSRRFPSVVWRDMRSGSVLARCSQPEVGWLGWRSTEDEDLLQNISKACSLNAASQPQASTPSTKDQSTAITAESESAIKKMLIVDARSYAAAVANRAKGGGVECSEYYPNCEIQFMNLANIHTIRKSFHALRALCAAPADQPNWLSLLENTKWHGHLSGLMRAALMVVNTLDEEGRPVLVHCSDGWDRTPQITALSQLFLDPYYRTIEGFRVLVEKEWLDFGHKFADRCGHGVCTADTNERCPVFLQFLDCVHQTLTQVPCAFQFNEAFLVKLVQHVYSCLFGTFLGNHTASRLVEKVPRQTCSVWTLLQPSNNKFRNYLYTPGAHQVLRPSYHLRHMYFWSSVYLSDATETMPADMSADTIPDDGDLGDNSPSTEMHAEHKPVTKTRSCENIVATLDNVSAGSGAPRRLSDPSIVTDSGLCGKEKDISLGGNQENKGGKDGVTGQMNGVDVESVVNKQIVIEAGEVRYTPHSPSDMDIRAGVDSPPDDSHDAEPELETQSDAEEEDTSCIKSLAEATCSSPPVSQAISDRDTILKHSTNDNVLMNKHSSSETAIETSTDTLTGDMMEQSFPGSGDSKAAVSTTRRQQIYEDGKQAPSGDEDDEAEDTYRLAALSIDTGLSVLGRSTDISTSTTDISDSHVQGSLGTTHQVGHHKGGSVSLPSINGQSMSLRLDNLLKLHIPESTKFLDYNLAQNMLPTQPLPCGTPASCSRDSEGYTPPTATSRTPSSSSPTTPATEARCWRWAGRAAPCALDQDGLVTWLGTGQARLVSLEAEYQARIEQLTRQLHVTRAALQHYASGATANVVTDNQDNSSLADSQESGERASSLTSDMSWEPVEEKDARMTLWVPDHAVTHCAGCDLEFWIVRRRHHCRNCGHVFCNECTGYSIPVPQQQLNTPVRVCRQCFVTILAENPSIASSIAASGALHLTGFTAGSASQVPTDGCSGSAGELDPNQFVFSNGHGLVNGNGNMTTPTCGGGMANGHGHPDHAVTVSTS